MKTYRQFIQYLLEDRLDTLKTKYGNLNTEHDPGAQHKNEDIVTHFAEKADPSPNKEHTQWILNQYQKGNIRQEDHPRIHATLSAFRKYKNKLAQKDLNSYTHIADVDDAISPHLGKASSEREKVKEVKSKGAKLIHDENGVKVHHLKTREAACVYGKGTKWCTAANKKNMFSHYNSDGPLYHVIAKDENGNPAKYQFHHESKQYMDAADRQVNMYDLVKRNPELRNVKEFQGKHPALTSDANFDKHLVELAKEHSRELAGDPRITTKHLDKLIEHRNIEARHAAARHPKATKEHLDKAINDEWYVRQGAAKNPNATKEHLDKTINDEHWAVREAAAENPNATKEHLDRALHDKHPSVRHAAARHPNATKEHLDKALNDEFDSVRQAAAKHPNATKAHLDRAINDDIWSVKRAAAKHPNATKAHLDRAINDEHAGVREAATSHLKASKEHLDKALNDEHWAVRQAAAKHPNATKEHLDKAINDKDMFVRHAAAGNPNATKEHLDKAMNDDNWAVRQAAVMHPNATKEHLDKALNDKDEDVRGIAKTRLANKDHK